MTKSNNADAFKMHCSMMRLSGVWPVENPGLLYKLRTIATWILSVGLTLTMIMEVINDIRDFVKLSKILYSMTSVVVYVIKLSVFTYQRPTFLSMLNFLKNPIFVTYPDNLDHYMAKTIKVSTLIAYVYRYLCLCGVTMYTLYPVVDNKPLIFPFPWDTGRYRYLMYLFQVVGISCSAWNNSCLDTLTTSLMGIGAAQLDTLKEKILRISQEDNRQKRNVIIKLKQCAEHHSAIIKFIESIEEVFTIGLLFQFLASIIVICNTMFNFVLTSASSSEFFMLANYFAVMIIQLSMYCWYGNEIMWKSASVGQACYMSNWHHYGEEACRYLFIIMERSKRPLSITALKFSKLSLAALSSILQWSYSFLALMLKMYSKRTSSR